MAFKMNLSTKEKKRNKFIDDVRVLIAILAVFFIGIIIAIVLGVGTINKKTVEITEAKTKYEQNQKAINNLKALQRKSAEYEKQRDEYDAMIPKTFDQTLCMGEMEKRAELGGCLLTDINFETPQNQSGKVNQVNIKLTVAGDYTDIMKLINSFVSDKEFMRVDAINMKNEKDSDMIAMITVVKFFKG